MKKEKKISFRHFDNLKLKPFLFHEELINKLYFQITFERKNYNFNCLIQEEYYKLSYACGYKINRSDLIKKNEKIIEGIIELIKEEDEGFSYDKFIEYYETYSINMFPFIDQYIEKTVLFYLNKFRNKKYFNLLNSNIDSIRTFVLILQKIDQKLYNKHFKINSFLGIYGLENEVPYFSLMEFYSLWNTGNPYFINGVLVDSSDLFSFHFDIVNNNYKPL